MLDKAVPIAGAQHVLDNALQQMHERLPFWDDLFNKVKVLLELQQC